MSAEFFNRRSRAASGFDPLCRECRSAKKREEYYKDNTHKHRPKSPPTHKACTKCGVVYPNTHEHFYKSGKREGALEAACRACHREQAKARAKDKHHKQREKTSWFRELKETLSCTRCGEHHPATLDFHHIDPNEKNDEVSALVRRGLVEEAVAEMTKCVVLCANCHRKEHWCDD